MDEPTGFLVFNTYGAEDIGPHGFGFGAAVPGVVSERDQLDLTGLTAGPSAEKDAELFAGGIGYRRSVGDGATTLYGIVDYGDARLGTTENLALDIEVRVASYTAGARRTVQLPGTSRLIFGGFFAARTERADLLGSEVFAEELRSVRAFVRYDAGRPFAVQKRLAFIVTKGIKAFGATFDTSPGGPVPGVSLDFLRMSFGAEAAVPLVRRFSANAGVIGQWTEDRLPTSQRCGYGTNSYARGFDLSYVNGDRCLGARTELAYDFVRPVPGVEAAAWTQGFVGIDFGIVSDVGTAFETGSTEQWSSASVGLRGLRGDSFVGDVVLTSILDDPGGVIEQDDVRLWVRGSMKF